MAQPTRRLGAKFNITVQVQFKCANFATIMYVTFFDQNILNERTHMRNEHTFQIPCQLRLTMSECNGHQTNEHILINTVLRKKFSNMTQIYSYLIIIRIYLCTYLENNFVFIIHFLIFLAQTEVIHKKL